MRKARPVLILTLAIAAMPSLQAQSVQRAGKSDRAAGKTDQPPSQSDDADPVPAPRPGGLRMSRAVVCKSIFRKA